MWGRESCLFDHPTRLPIPFYLSIHPFPSPPNTTHPSSKHFPGYSGLGPWHTPELRNEQAKSWNKEDEVFRVSQPQLKPQHLKEGG